MRIRDYLERSQGDSPANNKEGKEGEEIKPPKSPFKEVFVLTHKNCPDGCAFVVLAKKLYERNGVRVFVYFSNHKNVNKQFERLCSRLESKPNGPSLLLIGDIAPDEQELAAFVRGLDNKPITVRVYDHHKTSEWLCKLPPSEKVGVLYDEQRSASKILFDDESQKNPSLGAYKTFIEATNDRDLWLKQHPMSNHIATLHQIYGDKLYVERFVRNPVLEPTQEEQVVVEYHKRQELRRREALLSRMLFKTDDQQLKYGLIYGEGSSSDVLNEAMERFELDYALLVNLNTQKVSVRSRGKFDCSSFAALYEGGGHKRASGFTLKNFVPPKF